VLGPRDYRGLYSIIPTPVLAGATFRPGEPTVDLDETARLVDALVRAGSAGIIALGTTGECATLPSWDYEPLVRCLCETVAGRVPLFIGATALGQAEVMARLAVVRDAGAEGSLLGLPMWQPLTTQMAVRYYAAVSEAYPGLSIMVYANQRAFRFAFDSGDEFWAQVAAAAPTVTSAKFSRVGPLQRLLEATRSRVHFMPNDSSVGKFYEASPETTSACWATSASMGPAPCLAMISAVLGGNRAEAGQVAKDIAWANEPVQPFIADPTVFASFNIQIERVRIAAAGFCDPGPIRPPYDVVPEEYAAPSRECGQRWRQLCEKYASHAAGAGVR
jgi:trans-o-hydroxybenzylidenepyruvate hydratase-aldolase